MKLRIVQIIFTAAGIFLLNNVSEAIEYSGMIINDIGRPAANATITIRNVADPNKTMSAVTDTTGIFTFNIITEVAEEQPIPFELYGNFPNPFNPLTRISYSLDRASEVMISIYNILGQHVRTLEQGFREPGYYTAIWDGKDESGKVNSAGVYLYKLDAGERFRTSKMLLVDASTGSWISAKRVPVNEFKENDEILYIITITHPDAETLTLGPITINATTDTVLTINRIMTKMKLIHKNTYIRGTKWYPYTRPLHTVKITHDYFIDKYEVTAGLFSDVMNHAQARGAIGVDSVFVKNTEGDSQILFKLDTPDRPTNICVEYKNGIFVPKEGCDKYPITYVSWYGANFFCYERSIKEGFPQAIDVADWSCDFTSTGYRLPTDAEWELAAAWTDQREYAFGRDPGYYKPMNTQLNEDGFDEILSPVGWFSPQGDSHDGVSDLSGNIYEWAWDWMEYYKPTWEDSLLVDPTGPVEGWNKICRGGSAYGCFRAARTADKANVKIYRTSRDIGFRTIRMLKD